ncbi:MAG: GntP family permease [Pseudomonadota bacterium]
MLGLLGVLLALGGLITLAYRGWSVVLLAPVAAAVATLFALEAPLLASYTQIYMPALGRFIIAFFPLFLLGALFGRLMDDTGAARRIADSVSGALGPERAILATVLACAALTYGGVSLFVVAFAVYPVADALFRAGGVPKRLLPAAIALGAFTFTMSALPGAPAIQNAIPMPFFGTTPFAAPGIGLIAGAIMLLGGLAWLDRCRARSLAEDPAAPPYLAGLPPEIVEEIEAKGISAVQPVGAAGFTPASEPAPGPALWLAALPIALVIGLNFLLSVHIFPALDTSYLAEPAFGAVTIDAVRGVWAIIVALCAAILSLLAISLMDAPGARPIDHKASLMAGADASIAPLFNTASLVGFGAVVASLPAFALVRAGVEGLSADPVIGLAISASVLAGLTGSASGGMTIALDALGADALAAATASGVAPELLHRVTTLATGGLDALPHNGAVVTLLAICGLGHRQAYGPIFAVAVAIPLAALAAALALGGLFGAF